MDIPLAQQIPDQYQSDPYGQVLINVVNTANGVRMRPGSEELVDLMTSSAVDGIYDWDTQNVVVAVSNGSVFTVSDGAAAFFSYLLLEDGGRILLEDGSGSLLLESTAVATDVTNDTLNSGMRIKFADYGEILFMADGSRVYSLHSSQDEVTHAATDYICIKNNIAIEPGVTAGWATYWSTVGATGGAAWDTAIRYGSGTADVLEDPTWPTSGVGFVEIIDKYLFVMKSGTEQIFQSVSEEPWNCEGAVFSAEQLPDDVNCMAQYAGDLVVGGPKSIQWFQNDGTSATFVPTNYGAVTTGVLAPYSFREVDGTWIFLDNERRLVAMQGREPTPISIALNTFIQTIPFMNDAISDETVLDGITYYVLRFPSSERTFAINVADGSWTEWNYLDTDGAFKIWDANCITYVPRWDLVVSGDRANGKLKKVGSIYSDDDGTAITDTIRSPRMQTSQRTRVAQLLIGLTKTADATTPAATSMSVRWRDDGSDWGTPRTITLDSNQVTDYVKRIYRLGSYRNNRQYEFTVPWPYAIQKVEQI